MSRRIVGVALTTHLDFGDPRVRPVTPHIAIDGHTTRHAEPSHPSGPARTPSSCQPRPITPRR